MKDTIFIDFDGVIRLWSDEEIQLAEQLACVAEGTLFSVAFAPEFLSPAIEGRIPHEKWLGNVETELAKRYNENVSGKLMAGWKNASWKVDKTLIKGIRETVPNCKLVLVTNATTKLSSDLEESGIVFDYVVNSAVVGLAKPALAFYRSALSLTNTNSRNAIFIDDSLSNVEAATSMGIDSIRHQNVEDTLDFVKLKCT